MLFGTFLHLVLSVPELFFFLFIYLSSFFRFLWPQLGLSLPILKRNVLGSNLQRMVDFIIEGLSNESSPCFPETVYLLRMLYEFADIPLALFRVSLNASPAKKLVIQRKLREVEDDHEMGVPEFFRDFVYKL